MQTRFLDAEQKLFALAQGIAPAFLRITMGVIVFWIGALKFVNPDPVVELTDAAFPFLATDGFVYVLGAIEIVAAVLLLANLGVRYVGLVLLALLAGTLTIFVLAPSVTYGDDAFPRLSLTGQFLLKDLVLFAAAVTLVAADATRHPVPARVTTGRQLESGRMGDALRGSR